MRNVRAGLVVCAIAVGLGASSIITSSAAEGGFGDVPPGSYYARAVSWLVDEGITTGTSPGCFSPNDTLTRAQMATFIHRYRNTPSPAGGHPFTDVPAGTYYTNAVNWLHHTGITTGTTPTTYSPETTVTRAQAATMLWRLEGSDPTNTGHPFTDVPAGTYYTNAVAWMHHNKITTGTSPTAFSPADPVTRAQFATLLHRLHGSPPATLATNGTCGATPGSTGGEVYFSTLPPGADLPSGQWCAARVKPRAEVRPANTTWNQTRGTDPNDRYPRVDGNFTGTTDEIIQWAACKWGIDENVARAQIAKESYWWNGARGDMTNNPDRCHPDVRESPQCPESVGLGQVRWRAHSEAFEDSNALTSSAYNVDYTYAVWRDCYDGNLTWLNNVERGATYTAGDLEGCLGVWFTGRWYIPAAHGYIDAVNDLLAQRVWETLAFHNWTPPNS